MATYYYVKCHTCNEYTGVIGRNERLTGIEELTKFLNAHQGHSLEYGHEYMDTFAHRTPRFCDCGKPATQAGFLDIPYCDECYERKHKQ
jgi:hypothetical protein